LTTFGVLTDRDIKAEASAGRLITGNFVPENAQQSCYELRAGRTYYDISAGGDQLRAAPPEDYILIKPHQMIVVITEEFLRIPDDIVGRVMLKGKLFSLGLAPINTYADPGFDGHLGVVLYNTSPNFLKIAPGDSLAKIEFERLHEPVETPYQGQHGHLTEIWPIPRQMIISRGGAVRDSRMQAFSDEARRAFGEEIGDVFDRIFRYERRLLLSFAGYMGVAMLIVVYVEATGHRLTLAVGFLLGLITNIASSVLTFMATRGRRR
jgi:dCTP deaminase